MNFIKKMIFSSIIMVVSSNNVLAKDSLQLNLDNNQTILSITQKAYDGDTYYQAILGTHLMYRYLFLSQSDKKSFIKIKNMADNLIEAAAINEEPIALGFLCANKKSEPGYPFKEFKIKATPFCKKALHQLKNQLTRADDPFVYFWLGEIYLKRQFLLGDEEPASKNESYRIAANYYLKSAKLGYSNAYYQLTSLGLTEILLMPKSHKISRKERKSINRKARILRSQYAQKAINLGLYKGYDVIGKTSSNITERKKLYNEELQILKTIIEQTN